MITINKYISDLKPYKLASHKIWESNGKEEILKLDWNEATIPASPKVKEAVLNCIDAIGFRFYPDVENKKLIEEIANYCDVTSDLVQYYPSSDMAHEYIVRTYLMPSDKVLILGPTYDNFRLSCESCGAKVIYTEYQDGFKFSMDEYLSVVKEVEPKIAYICNPNNPTGTQLKVEEIEKIITLNSNTLFLIDEAYVEFSGVTAASLVDIYDNLIITRTFSKAFALANFRIGYIISAKVNVDNINRVRNAKNISSFSQEAAIAALSDLDYTFKYVQEVNLIKKSLADNLVAQIDGCIKSYVGGGNFILLKFDDGVKKDFFLREMEAQNVFLRDLSHVQRLKNHVRLTVGTELQMKSVVNKVEFTYAKKISSF